MKFLYIVSSIVSCIFAYKLEGNTTDIITRTSINVTDSIIPLNSSATNQKNITLTRITQPSTTIERFTEINNITTPKSEFVPSPQLESYFEYNRYPVIPAFPEAKQLYSHFTYIPPSPTNAIPTYTQSNNNNNNNNIKFDNPKETNHSYKGIPSAQDKQLFFNGYEKPLRTSSEAEFPSFKYYEKFNYGPSSIANPTIQNYEWYNKAPFPTKSTPFMGHPYPFITDFTKKDPTIQTPKVLIAEQPHPHPHSHPPMMMNPWKKAAKIFAAILPIGLLISALTPNILTITTSNETYKQQCRKLANRAESSGLDKIVVDKWSKPGCEARLLCETAVKEEHMNVDVVKKLFWTFVSQNAEDTETPGELEAVSKAIREKRCDRVLCRQNREKKMKDDDI